MAMLDHKFEPNSSAARRVEVFVGTGGGGAVSPEVARRHGISAQQLFGWRRAARLRGSESAAAVPDFAPVMLEAPARELRPSDGAVPEIVVGAMVARIPLTADGATLARIVRALRGAS